MPTYEYTCKNCGQTIEVFQSFSDRPLKKHKECGGQLQKVFHARGIVFKGGGFYATDSKSAAGAKKSSDEKASDSSSTDSKSSESKSSDSKSSDSKSSDSKSSDSKSSGKSENKGSAKAGASSSKDRD